MTTDAIGNLTNDGTWSYTWQHGRQLAQMSRPDASGDTEMILFRYDSGGHRIGKDSGIYHISYSGGEIVYAGETTRTSYSYLGDTLTQINISAPTGNSSLHFTYDELGPMSVTYDGAEYFYLKNAQGDVTGLVNSSGTQVVAYTYDAWGNPLTTTGTMADTLGKLNPFRYRGYVYDTETGLYYLQSRYYNPETGRFINADSYALTGQGVLSGNMFAYCGNNPIVLSDSTGNLPFFAITAALGAVVGAIAGGIIAAKRGANVWKGIGIGAVAGALIGAGAGMATGAALAGSLTASTGAVVKGGSTLIATIGSGGFGAGGTYIANNLSQVSNRLAPSSQVAASKMQDIASKGKAGEVASGITKNTMHIPSLTNTAAYRIPDGLTETVLSEVKNYSGTLSYTNQLRDFALYSQSKGLEMPLYTNARLTGPLQRAVDSGLLQVFPLN